MNKKNYLQIDSDQPIYTMSGKLILNSVNSYNIELEFDDSELYMNAKNIDELKKFVDKQKEISKRYVDQIRQILSVANVLCESEMIKCHKELEVLVQEIKTLV